MSQLHIKKFFQEYAPILIFIGIDLLFVILDLLTYTKFKSFNLDGELNFPTYYQTVKLYTVSLFAFIYTFGYLWKRYASIVIRFFWIGMAIGSLYLSIDEVNQLHEKSVRVARDIYGYDGFARYSDIFTNLGYESSKWMLIYIPILFIVIVSFMLCYKQLYVQYKSDMYIIVAMTVLFVLIFSFEMVGTSDSLDKIEYHRWVVREELTEMVAISLLLGFVLKQIRKVPFYIKE